MIRKIIFASLALGLSLFATEPSWYHNLPNTTPNTYLGYGNGHSESEATQNALNSIASQISTKIDTQTVVDKKFVDGSYKKDIKETSSQKTKANLSDYKTIKMGFDDGEYFVAIEYQNIPSLDKFISKIKTKITTNEKQNSYISKSFIASELKKALGFDVDFRLKRKDGKWYLQYQDVLQLIDTNDFEKFFTTVSNESLLLKTNKKNNILYDGDRFYFEVNSKQDGYLTILAVYEDGTVTTLFKNIPLKKDKLTKVPNEENESYLETGLIDKGVETFELEVAIFAKEKILYERFATAGADLETNERYKNFDELIEFLEGKSFAALKVVTKPR